MFQKLKEWYKQQTDSTKVMLWVGLIAIIMILINLNYVVDGVVRGYNYYMGRGYSK